MLKNKKIEIHITNADFLNQIVSPRIVEVIIICKSFQNENN